jgi:hypothetical protein
MSQKSEALYAITGEVAKAQPQWRLRRAFRGGSAETEFLVPQLKLKDVWIGSSTE